jgi:hypothetical protein
LLVFKAANLAQFEHSIIIISHYSLEVNMNTFIPFIHQPKPKKKEQEVQVPLYIELEPPPAKAPEKKEDAEERGVVVIEL